MRNVGRTTGEDSLLYANRLVIKAAGARGAPAVDIPGSPHAFFVRPSEPAAVFSTVGGFPTQVVSGDAASFNVTLRDAFGNRAPADSSPKRAHARRCNYL